MTIAIVLGLWLVLAGLGSFVASKAVAQKSQLSVSSKAYGFLSVALAIFVFVDLWLIRSTRSFFALPPGEPLSVVQWLAVAVTVLLPVCFVLGAQFVLAASVASASGVYIAESVGAVTSGALLSLLFLSLFEHASILALFVALHAFSSSLLVRSFHPTAWHISALLALVAGGTIVTSPFVEQQTQKLFWKSMVPNASLYRSQASPYGTATVIRYADQLSVYQNGHLLFTLPEGGDVSSLAHLILLQHPKPNRVLLIGGLGGWVQAVLQHPKVIGVDWVELDPTIPHLVMQLLPRREREIFSDPRLAYFVADGRSFIRQIQRPYDVVIVVASDPTTAAVNRFFTKEFFAEVAKALNPGGVFALHGLHEPPSGFGELYFARNHCVYNTLLSVFCKVLVVPSSPLTLLAYCSGVQFASDEPSALTLNESTLLQRARERGLDNINLFAFTDSVQVERVNYELKTGLPFNPLEREEAKAPHRKWLNSDSNPTVYFLSSLLWLRMGSERLAKLLEALVYVPHWSIWLLAILPLMLWLLGRRKSAERLSPTIAISVIGAVGMLAELTILLGFQSRFGTLYQQVGLLFALFMLGLALGAWFAGRQNIVKSLPALSLLLLTTSITVLAWVAVSFCFAKLPSFAIATLCGLFIAVVGGLVGAAFPLTVNSLVESQVEEHRAAGMAYTYDLFGGAIGTFLLGALLLPLWGTTNLLLLCSASCVATSLICWTQSKRERH